MQAENKVLQIEGFINSDFNEKVESVEHVIEGGSQQSPWIQIMHDIRDMGVEIEQLCERMADAMVFDNKTYGSPDAEASRWLAIGKTDIQKGLMELNRSVMHPNIF